jgi:hypothetical protein
MTREKAIENLKILKEDYWDDDGYGHETKQYDDTMLALDMAIKTLEEESNMEQFVEWVATEIFDEDWKYNKHVFAEIACRKLAKLGIVRKNGGTWELVEPQESKVQE